MVTFPEAVNLATILTSLHCRRHVALEWDIQPFYQRIADSTDEQACPGWPDSTDPVRKWARTHRARFGQLRGWSWVRPPSPSGRFK